MSRGEREIAPFFHLQGICCLGCCSHGSSLSVGKGRPIGTSLPSGGKSENASLFHQRGRCSLRSCFPWVFLYSQEWYPRLHQPPEWRGQGFFASPHPHLHSQGRSGFCNVIYFLILFKWFLSRLHNRSSRQLTRHQFPPQKDKSMN